MPGKHAARAPALYAEGIWDRTSLWSGQRLLAFFGSQKCNG